MSTFRLRRCTANTDAWMIVLMRDDGQESEIAHCCVTGIRPGDALNSALRAELFQPGDTLQIYESLTFNAPGHFGKNVAAAASGDDSEILPVGQPKLRRAKARRDKV